MTAAMDGLAEGNLEIASPDAGRGDEIGAMARAYEVFRQHEIDRRQMAEAEQQRERAHLAEQTAQRRREAAMAAEIATLTRAISAGDLEQRLSLDDKEERKSVVAGKSVSVGVDLGGARFIKQKTKNK